MVLPIFRLQCPLHYTFLMPEESSVDGHGNKTPFSHVTEDFGFRKIRIHSL